MADSCDLMPNIWGAGQLLAFSGVDGQTDWSEPFVLHSGDQLGSLDVKLPAEVHLGFENLPRLQFHMILGDVMVADSARGPFRTVFLDRHVVAGQVPRSVRVTGAGRELGENAEPLAQTERTVVSAAAAGGRWALAVGTSADAAAGRAQAALNAELDAAVTARSDYVQRCRAPEGLTPSRVRLLRKAISVMKVNTESACGAIRRRWTTPDRWPHRNMWLWDSAFHGIGLAYVDPDLGQDIVLAMLEQGTDAGMLPHMVTPESHSSITQPPLLAWSVWHLFRQTRDRTWAEACLPLLQRYLDWIRLNRDRNGNAIPEWQIEGNPLCRSGESGLDNSPRFDRAVLLDAVDFAAFLGNDYQCLAHLAEALDRRDLAQACREHARRIAVAVNERLWCEAEAFYLDRAFAGEFVPVKAASGFMPLFAGIATPERAEALRRHLRNRRTFATPFPVPSVALDSGTYCKDMWRGPAWVNLDYLIYRGLQRCGFTADAAALRRRVLDRIDAWYRREGCLFEFYDSLDVTSPRGLDRKQRLISGRGIAPISDYHWTAALTAALIIEEAAGPAQEAAESGTFAPP